MKKLFVLLVLVVAMVAAPVFAEVTETSWAGDFQYKMGGDFSSLKDSTGDQDLDLSITGAVGEFTTFDLGFEADPDKDAVTSNNITMTQDFGAMYDLGLTLKMTVGLQSWGPAENDNVYDWDIDESGDLNSFLFEVGSGPVMVSAFIAPVEAANELRTIGLSAGYSDDMIDATVYFYRGELQTDFGFSDPAGTSYSWDGFLAESGYVAADVKVTPVEGTSVYFQIQKILDDDLVINDGETVPTYIAIDSDYMFYTVGASYEMDALTVGIDLVSATYEDSDFAEDSAIALGVGYALSDMVTVKAGTYYPLDDATVSASFDAGVVVDVDSVSYTIGAAFGADENSMDWTYVAPYSSAGFAEDYAISFKMDVDF